MGLEFVGSLILQRRFGSGLTVWGSLISVFMAGMALGYYVGGKLADRKPTALVAALATGISALWIVGIAFVGDSICNAIFFRINSEEGASLLAATILFLPVNFLMGWINPLVIKMESRDLASIGRVAGRTSAIWTLGSIGGALVTAFYLIGWIGVRKSLYLGAALSAFVTLLLSVKGLKRGAAIVLLATVLWAPSASGVILYDQYSQYHHVIVEQSGSTRLLKFDNAIQSMMDVRDGVSGAFEYVDYFHMAFLFNPRIQSVYFVGLGGGSAPKQYVLSYPDVRVTVAEIDPVVVKVAERFFFVRNHPSIQIVQGDGRAILEKGGTYDQIVVDAYASGPYGAYLPFHLTSKEFFQIARRHLSPNGVFAINVVGTVQGWNNAVVRSVYKTMAQVFPNIYVFPVRTSQNVVLVAPKMDAGIGFFPTNTPQAGTPDEALAITVQKLVTSGQNLSEPELIRRAMFLTQSGKTKIRNLNLRASSLYTGPIPLGDAKILTDDHSPLKELSQNPRDYLP